MAKALIRFLNILVTGLIAGTVCGIWLGYNPAGFSAQTYVEQQQNVITSLNTVMPLLGLFAIILTILSAFLRKKRDGAFFTLLVAASLLIASGLVTRLGNQPINAVVMTWSKSTIPDNWADLRDQWWSLHTIRTGTSLLAFALVVWAHIGKEQA